MSPLVDRQRLAVERAVAGRLDVAHGRERVEADLREALLLGLRAWSVSCCTACSPASKSWPPRLMKKLSPVETIRLVNLVARPENAIFQSRLGSLSAPLLRSGPFMVSSSLSPTEAGALSKKIRSATASCALLSGLTLASVSFALFSSDAEPPHATERGRGGEQEGG
jgi:hypothetical protein